VGFLWLLLGSYQEDEVRARYTPLPKDRAAWNLDVYVEPNFRLGFTFLRLWNEANKLLTTLGVSWTCSRISAFNTGSLTPTRTLGHSLWGALFFYAGRWQITLASIPLISISHRTRAPFLNSRWILKSSVKCDLSCKTNNSWSQTCSILKK
jgi:hypothetical protein